MPCILPAQTLLAHAALPSPFGPLCPFGPCRCWAPDAAPPLVPPLRPPCPHTCTPLRPLPLPGAADREALTREAVSLMLRVSLAVDLAQVLPQLAYLREVQALVDLPLRVRACVGVGGTGLGGGVWAGRWAWGVGRGAPCRHSLPAPLMQPSGITSPPTGRPTCLASLFPPLHLAFQKAAALDPPLKACPAYTTSHSVVALITLFFRKRQRWILTTWLPPPGQRGRRRSSGGRRRATSTPWLCCVCSSTGQVGSA